MENFYKKIRKRSDENTVLITVITALFYFLTGMGFTGIKYESNITMVISCLLCLYMSSIVFAINKGDILKSAIKCSLVFILGMVFKFIIAYEMLTYLDLGIAFGIFAAFFALGLKMGHSQYGKYIE